MTTLDKILSRYGLALELIKDIEEALDSTDLDDTRRVDYIIRKLEEYKRLRNWM